MKISTKLYPTQISRFAATLLLTAFAALFSACSKNETAVPLISGLMVVNAAPNQGTYNVYINNLSIPANTKGALPFLGTTSSYINISPGANTLKFTTASSLESVFTETTNLEADKAYSYFLINDVPNLSGLLIADDLSLSSAEKAFIRFVNVSPEAGKLDLAVDSGSTLVADKAFKAASEFISIDPKPYHLVLKSTSTGQILARLKDVTLTAGKTYSIVAAGVLNANDSQQPLRLQVITNR